MKKLKLYIDSSIDCQYCVFAISFMNRYKLQHEIVDTNQPGNAGSYSKAIELLNDQGYDTGIMPMLTIDDVVGFTGWEPVSTEYKILDFLKQYEVI
tara:strand:+ start:97 stop:384 length:288 start_codon:yes stop_codon:yes gene_type:complete